jgi:hypothetical protein
LEEDWRLIYLPFPALCIIQLGSAQPLEAAADASAAMIRY